MAAESAEQFELIELTAPLESNEEDGTGSASDVIGSDMSLRTDEYKEK